MSLRIYPPKDFGDGPHFINDIGNTVRIVRLFEGTSAIGKGYLTIDIAQQWKVKAIFSCELQVVRGRIRADGQHDYLLFVKLMDSVPEPLTLQRSPGSRSPEKPPEYYAAASVVTQAMFLSGFVGKDKAGSGRSFRKQLTLTAIK